MDATPELVKRIEPIVPLSDDELLSLFRKQDGKFLFLNKAYKADADLMNDAELSASCELHDQMREACTLTRVIAEVLRHRLGVEFAKKRK